MEFYQKDMEYYVPEISVRSMREGRFTLGPITNIGGNIKFNDAFLAFRKQAEDLHINLSYPIGSYYCSMEPFVKHPDAPTNFFSSDPNGNSKWPQGNYLTGYSRGRYGDFGNTPEMMKAYAAKENLELTGPVFQIYLHDEICIVFRENLGSGDWCDIQGLVTGIVHTFHEMNRRFDSLVCNRRLSLDKVFQGDSIRAEDVFERSLADRCCDTGFMSGIRRYLWSDFLIELQKYRVDRLGGRCVEADVAELLVVHILD